MNLEVLRLSAFPYQGQGGNPAGVVLDAQGLDDEEMQKIAFEVGFSETVFVTSQQGNNLRVRYFSPETEVDFCGHATIAAGIALGEVSGAGTYLFETNTGVVTVRVSQATDGFTAELSSQKFSVLPLDAETLEELLAILGWPISMLSDNHTPAIANAGNSHPILVLKSVDTLNALDYDFEALKHICRENNWPTLQLVAQESPGVWQSRNPFAFGGVYEDPATGSAALAFAVYLRETEQVLPGDTFVIKQGFAMSQPCLLNVTVSKDACMVSGSAIHIAN
jgi:PhzF family phenazine biosynthesis protein